jgi:hypothetical protein
MRGRRDSWFVVRGSRGKEHPSCTLFAFVATNHEPRTTIHGL